MYNLQILPKFYDMIWWFITVNFSISFIFFPVVQLCLINLHIFFPIIWTFSLFMLNFERKIENIFETKILYAFTTILYKVVMLSWNWMCWKMWNIVIWNSKVFQLHYQPFFITLKTSILIEVYWYFALIVIPNSLHIFIVLSKHFCSGTLT